MFYVKTREVGKKKWAFVTPKGGTNRPGSPGGQMTKQDDVTPREAEALLDLLNMAWADRDAMTDSDVKGYGWRGPWLGAARRGHNKLLAIAHKAKKQKSKKVLHR